MTIKPVSLWPGKPATRKYSVLPAWSIQDDSLTVMELRVLGALCLHANGAGVCWPSLTTLGRHVSRTTRTISRYLPRLQAKGYIRKLSYKSYPKLIKARNPRGLTTRWQILYQAAATPVPTYEDIYAAVPKVAEEPEATTSAVLHKEQGVRGIDAQLCKRLAGAFVAGVGSASGQLRMLDAQLEVAADLAAAGRTAEEIREYTVSCSLEWLAAGRSPPATLRQVVKWAGLG